MSHATRADGGRAGEKFGGLSGIWLATFLLLAILGVLWVLTTPVGSGPDESHQLIKAAAVVRGQWLGTHVPGTPAAVMRVVVPETYAATTGLATCYHANPLLTASCAPRLVASPVLVQASTHVGRYPPAYYLLVGLPSYLSSTTASIFLIRMLGMLFAAALVALAFALLVWFGGTPLMTAGLCLSFTPAAMYLNSVVEPNGFEAACAIPLWVALTLLARHGPGSPPRALVHTVGATASLLVLTRPLSPLWLACIASVTIVLVPRRTWQGWLRAPLARRWTGVVVVSLAAQVIWVATTSALDVMANAGNPFLHASLWSSLGIILGRTAGFLNGMVGVFGLYVTHAPTATYALIYAALGVLAAIGLRNGSTRERLALATTAVEMLVLPVILTLANAQRDCLIWQGRYMLPLGVGLPIMASLAASRRTEPHPAVPSLIIIAAVLAEIIAYWAILRRYTVTVDGPINPLFTWHTAWSPPLPSLVLAWAYLVGGLALGYWYLRLADASRPHADGTDRSRLLIV